MAQEVLVAGATGGTGRIIVGNLIQMGITPHVLVRDIPAAQKILSEPVTYHEGDVRNYEPLVPHFAGIDIVISAIGTRTPVGKNAPKNVDYQGVANLVKAAQFNAVSRFILISSIAVTHPDHPLNSFGKVLDWKLKGEEVLRQSGLKYTIVRSGGLLDTNHSQRVLIFDQGDRIMGMISRADLAETVLNTLQYSNSECTTFEVIQSEQLGQPDWADLFHSLKPAC
jgi:uncharacterized protein YbjT (DUF2867 family)